MDIFKNLEQKGIQKKDLLKTANQEIAKARIGGNIITAPEIVSSRHPKKICKLCGQRGCDVKYVGFYFHKKCLRQIRRDGKKMARDHM